MKKLIFLTVLSSLILIQTANAQINVTMFMNGKPLVDNIGYYLCVDQCYNFSLSVSGGTPPYTYLWNYVDTTASVNYCSQNLFIGSKWDSIEVVVTDTKNSQRRYLQLVMEYPKITQEICIVTIDSTTNKNKIIWEQSSDTTLTSYSIYKETSITDSFNLIGNVPKGSMSVFIDTSSNPAKVSAKYMMKTVSSCADSYESQPHKTIHLTINTGLNNTWNLIWENYEGNVGAIKNRIWRGSTFGGLQLIDSVSASSTTYTDLHPPLGVLFYAIEMIPQHKCNPSTKSGKSTYSSSFSNIADNKALVGINENQLSPNISIYPNPAIDKITINNTGNSGHSYNLSIKNIRGQEILKESLSFKFPHSIDISGIANGVYILILQNEKEYYLNKLIIKR